LQDLTHHDPKAQEAVRSLGRDVAAIVVSMLLEAFPSPDPARRRAA
jgi:hypothetical protein